MTKRPEADDRCAICAESAGRPCPSEKFAECTSGILDHFHQRSTGSALMATPVPLPRAQSHESEGAATSTPAKGNGAPAHDWRPPEWLTTLATGLREMLNGGAALAFPGLVEPIEWLIAKAGELQRRLNDLTATHLRTRDELRAAHARIKELTPRAAVEVEARLAAALERQGQGGHTAEADGYVCIPRDVAEQVAAAVAACEPYQRGSDSTKREVNRG